MSRGTLDHNNLRHREGVSARVVAQGMSDIGIGRCCRHNPRKTPTLKEKRFDIPWRTTIQRPEV